MSLLAVDIGNSRIKLGLFAAPSGDSGLSSPNRSRAIPVADWNESQLRSWLTAVPPETPWWVASVNRPAAERLLFWVREQWPSGSSATAAPTFRILTHTDLPIRAAVERPDRVGIDRLAGAAAVNRLRDPARPAIIVGMGTAITVDLISSGGVFLGGAILPGLSMSAKALDQFTDLLPHIPVEELADPPPPLGVSTTDAIRSGLFWGAIGAIRELIVRLSKPLDAAPELFFTGGAAPSAAALVDPTARYVEHLVLAGITLARP